MQELVSFISIMLGVVVFTAWAMWILFRPSGDEKTQDFARKSATDGLTKTVIENNELKNKITKLESQIKVLMSAGYKGKGKEKEKKAAPTADDTGKKKTPLEKVKQPVNEDKVKNEPVKTETVKQAVDKKEAEKKAVEKKETVIVVKQEEPEKPVEEKQKPKPKKDPKAKKQKKDKAKSKKKNNENNKSQKEEKIEEQQDENPSVEAEVSNVIPLSEGQRITDNAEKKKIADYLANIAETTERHMKEVEALGEVEEPAEDLAKYPDDNLKKIKGIGPHLEGKLKRAGIKSYQQISEFDENEIQRVSKIIGSYPRRIRREEWAEQALKLIEKS